jgi:hypothetical protein
LAAAGNAWLDISVHHGSPAYDALMEPTLRLLNRWVRDYGIQVKAQPSFDRWLQQYHGIGAEMAPFEDGDPQASWDACQAKHCFQLHEGRLWKCPPLAYLPLQHAKYGLSEKWAPYLRYQPLPPDCSDAALQAFVTLGAEPYCAMCPARPVPIPKAWPLPTPPDSAL